MQVETDEYQNARERSPFGERHGQCGANQGETDIVAQDVVVITPPREWLRGVPCGDLRNQSKSIKVGYDAGPGDHATFAPS